MEAWAPLLMKGLSAALRRDVGPERHAGKRGEFGAGQGRPSPERFVGTTSKPKVPRERREDGPAAAEVLRPALQHARPDKKAATSDRDSLCKFNLNRQALEPGLSFLCCAVWLNRASRPVAEQRLHRLQPRRPGSGGNGLCPFYPASVCPTGARRLARTHRPASLRR